MNHKKINSLIEYVKKSPKLLKLLKQMEMNPENLGMNSLDFMRMLLIIQFVKHNQETTDFNLDLEA